MINNVWGGVPGVHIHREQQYGHPEPQRQTRTSRSVIVSYWDMGYPFERIGVSGLLWPTLGRWPFYDPLGVGESAVQRQSWRRLGHLGPKRRIKVRGKASSRCRRCGVGTGYLGRWEGLLNVKSCIAYAVFNAGRAVVIFEYDRVFSQQPRPGVHSLR